MEKFTVEEISKMSTATRKALFASLRKNRQLKKAIREALEGIESIYPDFEDLTDLSQAQLETAIVLRSVLDILESCDK